MIDQTDLRTMKKKCSTGVKINEKIGTKCLKQDCQMTDCGQHYTNLSTNITRTSSDRDKLIFSAERGVQ